jgi:hypothetical protein
VISSPDGTTWPSTPFGFEQTSKFTPSLAYEPEGAVFIAFNSNDSSNRVLMCFSPNGVAWTTTYIDQTNQFASAVAVFNNGIYVAFISDDSSDRVLLSSSPDGTWWTQATTYIDQTSRRGPAVAVFNNRL